MQLAKRKFKIVDDEEDDLEDIVKKQKMTLTPLSFDDSPFLSQSGPFTSSFLPVSNIVLPPKKFIPLTLPLFEDDFFDFSSTPLFDFSKFSLDDFSPKSEVVSVYDPSTPELFDLARSAQDLFAYKDSGQYVNQRIVKLYDVRGNKHENFIKRSTAKVHAALQINHMTPMISVSGEYGTPTKVVKTWMGGLTWRNEKGETLKGFTSPSIGDSSIKFNIPKKISEKSSHRFSAHAEVNAYRELYRLYMEDQATPSSIVKFRMATNIAHCAECWWAAYALFKKLGIDIGKLETSSPTENVLFNQWTEPWEGFYKDLGMDSSPFRDKKGKLKVGFKKNTKASPLELNKLQKDVTFL